MLAIDEKDLTRDWIGGYKTPLVSICCITFNHEKYIEEALDSFLMQKTNFPFEVLVHDDCSTDSTTEKIQCYENKYPNIIKPIYQKENQKSKGYRMNPTFNFPRASGDYLAICEGDDYWVSPDKLQKQIDVMLLNPSVEGCFHSAIVSIDGREMYNNYYYSPNVKVFSAAEVILCGGDFCPTASLLIKKCVFNQLPDFFYKKTQVGDYYLQIFSSLKSGLLYLPEAMAVYRKFSNNSWSSKNSNKFDLEGFRKAISFIEQERSVNLELSYYLDNRYDSTFLTYISGRYLALFLKCIFFGRKCRWRMSKELFVGFDLIDLPKSFFLLIRVNARRIFGRFTYRALKGKHV